MLNKNWVTTIILCLVLLWLSVGRGIIQAVMTLRLSPLLPLIAPVLLLGALRLYSVATAKYRAEKAPKRALAGPAGAGEREETPSPTEPSRGEKFLGGVIIAALIAVLVFSHRIDVGTLAGRIVIATWLTLGLGLFAGFGQKNGGGLSIGKIIQFTGLQTAALTWCAVLLVLRIAAAEPRA